MLRGLTRALSPRRAALLAAPAAAAVGLHLAWARRPATCEPVEPLGGVEPAEAEPSEWNHVIAGTLPAVVSIRVNRVRAFDTATAGTAQATGFVVDAKNGFILTNRHVAGPGPIVADAVFQNNEEVPLQVVYMDPVHDFALLQFDPAAVKHMQLVEIPLAPHEAAVATEIAIIGNNAGEKCSISRTTLARLDRNAPAYNRNSYNDFNTFYFQASSSTSGGSSGSPVINRHGRAIAINAGGKIGTSAGFFLPLDRVKRALALVQAAAAVPRGSVCTVCLHQPFDEARRLGLPEELEACIRASSPSLSGLLVVAEVLPRGPADGKLQPGDILIEAAGEACTGFVGLEEALDSHVLRTVTLAVCRGGQLLHVDLDVADLHSLSPAHFFEFGGAVLNELSYQQARNHGIAVGGVYVAHPGYTLRQARISRGAIITSVNAVETPTLESFARVITAAPHGEKLTFRSHDIAHPEYVQLSAARMDRKWFPLSECRRRGHLSAWRTSRIASAVTPPREESAATASPPCDAPTAPTAASAPTAAAAAAAAPPPAATASEGAAAAAPLDEEAAQRRLASALVTVDFTRPFFIDGETGMRYRGTGLVLDAKLGLVAVDRNTVNTTLGDVFVTIGGRATVPANVAYVHPVHNFALVQFDPATVPADIHFSAAPIAPISRVTSMRTGAQVWLAGLKSGLNHEFDTSRRVDLVVRKTRLANSGWIKLPLPNPPRYQMYNCETFGLEVAPSMDGGAVADLSGDVVALWVSCAYQASQSQHAQVFRGLPIHLIDSVSRQLSRGEQPKPWRSLAVTFEPISLATARDLGVSDGEIAERGGADVPCVLCVAQVQNKSPAAAVLRGGDLVLRIDRQPVRSLYEAEAALEGRAAVALDVVRDGKELRLQCETTELHGAGTTQVVGWAGLMLQTAPEAVQAQRYVPPAGVYASYRFFGSPASRYDLPPTSHIVEVDSTPTPDLEAFLAITAHKQDGDVVRLKYVDIDGRSRMTTLKLDMTYWPTFVLQRTPQGGWARTEVQAAGCEPPVGASAS